MTGKIFLNYRREDTAGFAQALFARLEQTFRAESLFMDVEGGIKPGQDFVEVLEEQVSACDVMLVLIGPNWLTARDDSGRRRLDSPVDFVRVEVESALRFAKHVIPVLVQKTEMPRADALPESLKALARRNAVGLTHERFKPDVQGLIRVLEDALTEMEEARRRVANAGAAPAEKLTTERAAKVEEVTRAIGERVKLHAIAVPSPEQIAKAEELANWDFIKASESIEGFRDHLARFPQGVSDRWARVGLERLVWAGLPRRIDKDALNGFLAEFPNGAHAGEAARMRVQTRLIRVFAGHSDRVNSVAFSPDGCSALSGSSDDTLKLWDVATGKESRTFAGHSKMVNSVAFSPDGGSAVSSSWDNTLKLWDVATGKEIGTFTGHRNYVWSVAFSPDGRSVLSGSSDNTFKLWDAATVKELRTFAEQTDEVISVAFSPDGRAFLSGGSDKTLKLWDIATGREIRTFVGHTDSVIAVAFSPDGRNALSGSSDRTLKFWDVATGKEIRTLAGHASWVSSVACSLHGRSVLSGSLDDTLKLWDVVTGKEIRTLAGHTNTVLSVAFSPDGKTALSGSADNTLKLWDVT